MKRMHIIISGFVQGIGFRSFVKRNAQELGLTGWVRNLPNDWVEAVFEGEKGRLEEIIKICHEGPPLAQVDKVKTTWAKATGEFSGFEIISEIV